MSKNAFIVFLLGSRALVSPEGVLAQPKGARRLFAAALLNFCRRGAPYLERLSKIYLASSRSMARNGVPALVIEPGPRLSWPPERSSCCVRGNSR